MLEKTARFITEFGVVDILLPFVLLFTIIYAVLKKIKAFNNNNISTTIAAALSLITVASTDSTRLITTFISNASILLIVAVILIMILGLGGIKTHSKTPLTKWIITTLFIVVIAITLNQTGLITQQHLDLFLVPGIAIIVLLAILMTLFSQTKPQTGETQKATKQEKMPAQMEPLKAPTKPQETETTEKPEQRLVKQKRIEIPEGGREI